MDIFIYSIGMQVSKLVLNGANWHMPVRLAGIRS